MKKEFSFKNYFLYTFRYWLLVAILAVAGLAAGLVYGLVGRKSNNMVFSGSITICGFSSLAEDLKIGDGTDVVNTYNQIKSSAFAAMQSSNTKYALYKEVKDEWCAFPANTKLSDSSAREKFYAALSIREEDITLFVSFTQKVGSDKAFSQKVVTRFLEIAKERAIAQEVVLKKPTVIGDDEYDKLTVSEVEEEQIRVDNVGVLKGAVVGIVGGLLLGLIVTLIMYFTDKRITAYGDIAAVTGNNLLGTTHGAVSNQVCPRIDSELGEKKVLMICGDADMCYRLAVLYGEYSIGTERKTLRIDFAKNTDGDTFGEYMRGKALADCVSDEGGVTVLSGSQSWTLALTYPEKLEALKKAFGRIVIDAPYRGDNSLGVLSHVCDKVVYAVNQSTQKSADVLYMAQEVQNGDKALGVVLEKTGRSYVGGSVYLAPAEQEE